MKIKTTNQSFSDVRGHFDIFSSKLSDACRQLAFAGIAIIWLFKTIDKNGNYVLPSQLDLPLYACCLALFFDLIHYLYATIAWKMVMTNSKASSDRSNVNVPGWINVPTWTAFIIKITSVLLAYCLILGYIVKNVKL